MRKGRTGFRQQLVFAFCIGIILASLVSSFAIAYLSGHTIRDRFVFEGHQAVEALATQSTLALLYHSRENIQEYAEALLSSPDITGIAIHDLDHQPLLELGQVDHRHIAASDSPGQARLLTETERYWHFTAPVFTTSGDGDVSPFSITQPQAELLGYVHLTMAKATLRNLTGDLLKTNIIVSATLAAMLLLVLLMITGRVTRPIRQLAATMQRASAGEENIRASVDGPRDITEMQTTFNHMMDVLEAREIELRNARDEALESARVKGEFAATVSHELRTPLNGVLGMLELLQESRVDERQKEYLDVAKTSGESLLALINDILDFSRNDSGRIDLHTDDVDLQALLDGILSLVANQTISKGIDIGYSIDVDVPARIRTDGKRLNQIIVNLVGNAVKFTDNGEIAIHVALVDPGDHQPERRMLAIEVRDSGIGIPETAQRHIFEPFRQADGSTTRKYGGTGLGLAICRQLVEVMGGEITVSSQGNGATFRFTVAVTMPAAAIAEQPASANLLAGTRILIADDSDAVCRQAAMHCHQAGMHVDIAHSHEALQELLTVAADLGRDIDFLLLDCGLADGLPSPIPESTHVVLMGADRGPSNPLIESAETRTSVDKPLRSSSLLTTLLEIHQCRKGRRQVTPAPAGDTQSTARILVVEDNRSNQYVVTGMLDHLGAAVTVASNGIDAIAAAGSESFDLVLMDCNMPEMDGYETTRRIRWNEAEGHRIPVLAMTANTRDEDVQRCIDSGMDDYIAKPLKLIVLRDKLAQWLPPLARLDSAPDPDATLERTATGQDPAISQTLDRTFFADLRETLGAAFPKMLKVFVEDLPCYLSDLEAALKADTSQQITIVAHTIKGSASNIGARRLAEICRHLEEATVRGDSTTVRMLYNSVLAESESLIALINDQLAGKPDVSDGEAGTHAALILVVDDDRSTRITFRNILEDEGYDVIEADNGATAIEACNSHAPDLILLDGRMPVMDGFSACQQLKQQPDFSHIPVLIITGLEDEDSIEKAFSVGATDYIAKPVNFSVLRKRIAHLMHASRTERHMHRLAYSDPLTGLPNRVRFTGHLERLLGSRDDGDHRNLAVMFIDVDRFKLINDTLGHDAGDMLLKIVAERLHHCVRDGDMVARLGGDEFTVILDDISSRDVLASIARKICDAFSKPVSFLDQEIFITLSIGISMYPADASDMATLMKHADTAMFNAKRYRNDFRFFEYGMEADVARRLKLENDLRRAIERDELDVHYQPQTEARSGRLVGMEALVRWDHPERGLIPPIDFISLAEDTGLISQIGEIVMEKACRQLRTWMDAGYPALRMAVNLSARQLEKYEIINVVTRILDATGIPPACLELEITESVIMEHAEEMISVFRKLKDMGLHLAIDDFGTGYSSLAYLKRFPIDLLKIDRSFVQDIPDDQEDIAIITGVIAMARGLGLKIIAEGVETEAQVRFLRDSGCDYMQGYYFSAPIPAGEFELRFLGGLNRFGAPDSGNITPFKRS